MNTQLKKLFSDALDFCVSQTAKNISNTQDLFLSSCSVDLNYLKIPNASMELYSDWTSSFYTGMIWLSYELTHDEKYKKAGLLHVESFKKRLYERELIEHHDIGFLYILSCLSAYRILKDDESKKICIDAAYVLTERYQENINILQQNGSLTEDNPMRGRFIIDSLLNIPLLYWASEVTGDKKLYDIAYSHLKQVMKYIIKEDFSTYQVCILDPDTGKVIEQGTSQGFNKEGCWARGQAWSVYGLAISYKYTGDVKCIETAVKAADYFLAHIPADGVCAWDLYFMDNETQKDTSAAAICACGLLEIADILPVSDSNKERFYKEAIKIMEVLTKNHLVKEDEDSNGILKNGVYSLPVDLGVDECQIWGDYYYMEALVRIQKTWNSYWTCAS
ncbi:MAG: glycoside hydrolase family 88 protein [Oscillospiraceae bacterium]